MVKVIHKQINYTDMLTQERYSIPLELKNIGRVSPVELVTLSQEYIDHSIILKEYLLKNIGRSVKILTARMGTNGELGEKLEFSGLVKKIEGNLITFESARDPASGMLSDELHTYVIRTDSVLGVLPFLHSGKGINPFADAKNEASTIFLDFIRNSRNLLRTCLFRQTHYAEIFFQTETNGLRADEVIECEIKHVNQSNVEIKQIRKVLHANGGKSITLGNFETVLPFRTNTKFLKKIIIHYGSKLKISPYDDGEEF